MFVTTVRQIAFGGTDRDHKFYQEDEVEGRSIEAPVWEGSDGWQTTQIRLPDWVGEYRFAEWDWECGQALSGRGVAWVADQEAMICPMSYSTNGSKGSALIVWPKGAQVFDASWRQRGGRAFVKLFLTATDLDQEVVWEYDPQTHTTIVPDGQSTGVTPCKHLTGKAAEYFFAVSDNTARCIGCRAFEIGALTGEESDPCPYLTRAKNLAASERENRFYSHVFPCQRDIVIVEAPKGTLLIPRVSTIWNKSFLSNDFRIENVWSWETKVLGNSLVLLTVQRKSGRFWIQKDQYLVTAGPKELRVFSIPYDMGFEEGVDKGTLRTLAEEFVLRNLFDLPKDEEILLNQGWDFILTYDENRTGTQFLPFFGEWKGVDNGRKILLEEYKGWVTVKVVHPNYGELILRLPESKLMFLGSQTADSYHSIPEESILREVGRGEGRSEVKYAQALTWPPKGRVDEDEINIVIDEDEE